ncbi:MAG: IclR family transcriptional regulator [bacterium]|nr:IclR family transcriptional regulator [bacterium]MDT8366243.1 IclR family transcriptional regulator [bacterium]
MKGFIMANRPMDYYAKTLEKGLRILNLFDDRNSAWSLTEAAAKTGINLTSTYRLVNTFIKLGYLNKDNKSKLLRLGPMAVALGNRILSGFDFNRLIKPLVDEIHNKYHVSIDVSLFQSGLMVQIYNIETTTTLTYHQDVISDFLYFTATGKSVLANLPEDELEELINHQSFEIRTDQTIVNKEGLYADLVSVRERGYAINNEEYIKGLIAIGAPILNQNTGRPIGAISFTSTTLDHSLVEFEEKYSAILCDLARRLSGMTPNV